MPTSLNRLLRLLRDSTWVVRRGIPLFLKFNGIIFLGGYPYPERDLNGYFQRIRAVDSLFPNAWKLYIDHESIPGRGVWFERVAARTIVLRITPRSRNSRLLMPAIVLLALRCRRIYFHSVMRMEDNGLGALMHIPMIRKIVDLHGVVPEECLYQNDPSGAERYGRHESLAIAKCTAAIVVTNAMQRHFQQKYPGRLPTMIVYPVFKSIMTANPGRDYPGGKPVVVYAGGLQQWQQVSKMIDAIVQTADLCNHRFYCPDPQSVVEMLPANLRTSPSILVEARAHEELLKSYPQCHFGFVLRTESVVNNVACPTKLVEYLAMGIVPILDCEDIGDFRILGARYIRLADFVAGRIPDTVTRDQIAADNLRVYGVLKETARLGAIAIHESLNL